MDDPNLELGGASEGAEDLELELTAEEASAQGGDPLDEISDPIARADAKKWRAIARRKEKAPAPKVDAVLPKAAEPVVSEGKFLTKADFYKSNERKAILAAQVDPEIKANWSEISALFSSRRGKETAEDISADISDAIILFKAHNPEKIQNDTVAQLTETSVVKTGGGLAPKTTAKTPDLPNLHTPTQPKDWYKKKELA